MCEKSSNNSVNTFFYYNIFVKQLTIERKIKK